MKKRIYSFTECDAWEKPLNQTEIFDSLENNVRLTEHFYCPYIKEITIDYKSIEEVKEAIRRHSCIFDFDELEFPPVLDGYIYKYYLSLEEKTKEIIGYNIFFFRSELEARTSKELSHREENGFSFCDSETIGLEWGPPVKALEVIALTDEIDDIIEKNT